MKRDEAILPRFIVYRWLARFFLYPPQMQDLERYRTAEGARFLQACRQMPTLISIVDIIEGLVAPDRNLKYSQQYFADAYSRAFDVAGSQSALPYASIYLSERRLLYQKPAQDMNQILRQLEMTLPENIHEPADHLGVQLQVAAEIIERELCDRAVPMTCAEFVASHVLTWLPAFVAQCGKLTKPEPILTLAKTSLALARSDSIDVRN